MINWPSCFGLMVAHHGRSMWLSKATQSMAGKQKTKKKGLKSHHPLQEHALQWPEDLQLGTTL